MSIRVPSFFKRSAKVPGIFRSSSFATRAPRSSRRSTPRAAVMRSSEPKALTSTGMSKPSTCSNSRATLAPPLRLDTRSVISVISRSRETDTVTRCNRPCLSRCATNSRRSVNGTALLGIERRDEPAGDDGEDQAGDDADGDELPAEQRRFPRDDSLHSEEGPGGHVGDEGGQAGAGVGEDHHQGHADHGTAGRQHARHGGDEDRFHAACAPEIAGDGFLRDQDLKEAREDEGRDQTGKDEPEHRQTVAGANYR